MIVINTLSIDRVNLLFEFLNSYFNHFAFSVKNAKGSNINIHYYGCLKYCHYYLTCLKENNPKDELSNLLFQYKGEKPKISSFENDEIDDEESISKFSVDQTDNES